MKRLPLAGLLLLWTLADGLSSRAVQPQAAASSQEARRQQALSEQERELRARAGQAASAETLYALAHVLFLEQKAKDSLDAFTRAAAQRTPTAADLQTVALDYVLLDDYVDADRWMTRSVEGQPGSSEAWYDLGRIKYTRSQAAGAADAFQHALRLSPHSVKAENNLGLALEAEGKVVEAESAYRNAIAWQADLNKPSEQPLLNLGILLTNLDRLPEAESLLLGAYRIAPADAKVNEQLGRTYRKEGKLADSESALKRAAAISPETASIHYLLGQVYRKEAKQKEADAEFARVAALGKAAIDAGK